MVMRRKRKEQEEAERSASERRDHPSLWTMIDGGRYGPGLALRDGLLRAMCWGKSNTWVPMKALIEKVRALEERIEQLEKDKNK